LRFIVERHETTVQAVISAQEKQIDRIIGHVSRAHQ
jgi:hypothetical protein